MEKQSYLVDMSNEEKNWYKEAKNWLVTCPCCGHESTVSVFIQDPSIRISYYGFALSKCPKCKSTLKYDYERKQISRIEKGRKPFMLMFGPVRFFELFFLLVTSYLLIKGIILWLGIAYIALLLLEYSWEIFLKLNDDVWYVSQYLQEDMEETITRVALPISIIRWIFLVIILSKVL
jgi:hypothetical protein